jgi:hypothetical protein
VAVADDDVCDGVDNNCTDGTDADHPAFIGSTQMFFADADNDAFGDATVHDGAGPAVIDLLLNGPGHAGVATVTVGCELTR